jgi:two-component system copper resistance phosphate regulon response regulator CusR
MLGVRILVIEDNQKTADYVCAGLNENFFIAESASNGQEGLFLACQHSYDLIVLDVMMPQMDGWTFIKKFRETNQKTPVIFLTARDKVEEKVQGIEWGADDYLVKPFAFSELLVRIRSLLRRAQIQQSDVLQVADLNIDIQKHIAMRGQTRLHLSAKEFMLLLLLAKRSGEVLSRTFIAEQVWDINFDSETNAIDVAIKRLRAKVDGNTEHKLIHTIRGAGYVLEKR